MTIESKFDHINVLCKAFRAACKTVVNDELLLNNLELCLSEAATNVVEHAYHNKPGNYFDIIVGIENNVVVFTLIDSGDKIPANFIKFPKLKEVTTISAIPESGYGLFLINELMDEVKRSERDGLNILTIRKQI